VGDEGLVTWTFFDRNLRRGAQSPKLRVRIPLALPVKLLPE
jgi:hypothetical protein